MTVKPLPEPKRFWMVCRYPVRPHHRTEPKTRFATRRDAEVTARALAASTQAAFAILEAVAVVEPGGDDEQERFF